MPTTQQYVTQLRGIISSLPRSEAAVNLAYSFMQWENYVASGVAASEPPQAPAAPRRQRGRPAGSKSGAPVARTKAPASANAASPMNQVLKRIVAKPGISTAQLCRAYPKIRANHMGIHLTRLTKNGAISGTAKTGPWTATAQGVATMNASDVTNLGQVRTKRQRRATPRTQVTTPAAETELAATGT